MTFCQRRTSESEKLQTTNKCLDKISMDMGESMKSLEFTQDQLDEEIGDVKKKKYKKLDRNIKCVKNELLDPEVLSKLI